LATHNDGANGVAGGEVVNYGVVVNSGVENGAGEVNVNYFLENSVKESGAKENDDAENAHDSRCCRGDAVSVVAGDSRAPGKAQVLNRNEARVQLVCHPCRRFGTSYQAVCCVLKGPWSLAESLREPLYLPHV